MAHKRFLYRSRASIWSAIASWTNQTKNKTRLPSMQVYQSTIAYCGQAACGSGAGRRLIDGNGSVYTCSIPNIDMVQLQGPYPDAESCVSGRCVCVVPPASSTDHHCPHKNSERSTYFAYYVYICTSTACMAEDPNFAFAAFASNCADACYCSSTCSNAYAYFDEYDLYSFKKVLLWLRVCGFSGTSQINAMHI